MLFRSLSKILLVLMSFGGLTTKANAVDILDSKSRPYVYDTVSQPKLLEPKAEAWLVDLIQKEVPRFLFSIESSFPGAEIAFVGRDASFTGDVLESFYLSRGSMQRVKRVDVSGASLRLATDENILKYLLDSGLLKEGVPERPVIFFDVISSATKGGNQPKRILKIIYRYLIEQKSWSPEQAFKYYNFVGLAKHGDGIYSSKTLKKAKDHYKAMLDAYKKSGIDAALSVPLLSFRGADPLHKLTYPHLKWHEEFEGFEKNRESKMQAIPGAARSREVRSEILSIQAGIYQFFREYNFSEVLEAYAEKNDISIPKELRAYLSRTHFPVKKYFDKPLPNFIGQRLEIGDRVSVPGVGEMLIQKLLGSGVKGIVYQAQSNEGKVYALKLSKKLSSDNLDSLKKELINYEIIKETLFLQPQMHVIGNGYVVKELIKGKTLGDYLRSLPQEKVLEDKAVRQFQEMVAFAAKKAVFIADIKPDNIMINKHGDIVVVDSGRKTKVFDSSEEALRNYQEETRKKWKRFLPESIVDVIFENISAMTDKEFERIAKESSQKTFKTPAQIQRPVDISRIIRNSGFDRYSVEQLLNYGLELGESISTMNVKALGNDRFVSENIYRSSAGTSNLNITFSSKPSASCNAAFAKILEAALGK